MKLLLTGGTGFLGKSVPGLVGPGDRLWSYAFVDDAAEGHALALERARKGERYSSAKAERELGYRTTPLEEGLRRTLRWLREQRVV